MDCTYVISLELEKLSLALSVHVSPLFFSILNFGPNSFTDLVVCKIDELQSLILLLFVISSIFPSPLLRVQMVIV